MFNSVRSGRHAGGAGAAWGVVALTSGGGAVATALGGVAVGHPVPGLVIAGCVLILPWLLAAVLVAAVTVVAVCGRSRRSAGESTVEVIDALRRVIESLLHR